MSRLSDPAEDWVEILKLYGGRCWICGALWEHKDHYVPRALGGADEPDNWRSACTSEALEAISRGGSEVSPGAGRGATDRRSLGCRWATGTRWCEKAEPTRSGRLWAPTEG